jgi:ribosomal protein S18 acetylase RimI-like enzyme
VYGGHFPPLDEDFRVHPPPLTFLDTEGREIALRRYGEGPVDGERAAIVRMYQTYNSSDRALGIPPVTESDIQEWQDHMLADYCVLAWHGDQVVGQASLVEDRDGTYELAIFLDGDYQGAGIGTRLTETLLSYGLEEGVHDVWLLVERDNRPAINLYRDVGFVVADHEGFDLEMALSMGADRTPAPPEASAGSD